MFLDWSSTTDIKNLAPHHDVFVPNASKRVSEYDAECKIAKSSAGSRAMVIGPDAYMKMIAKNR